MGPVRRLSSLAVQTALVDSSPEWIHGITPKFGIQVHTLQTYVPPEDRFPAALPRRPVSVILRVAPRTTKDLVRKEAWVLGVVSGLLKCCTSKVNSCSNQGRQSTPYRGPRRRRRLRAQAHRGVSCGAASLVETLESPLNVAPKGA